MAEFEVEILDSGTLWLGQHERLTYSEAAPLEQHSAGVLYAITGRATPFGVFIPHHLDEQATEHWFQQTIAMSRQLAETTQEVQLPPVALARHSVFGCMVLVVPAPMNPLSVSLQQFQKTRLFLTAEQRAIQTMIALLHLLDSLRTQQLTLSLNTLTPIMMVDDSGTYRPTLLHWEQPRAASDVVALNGMLDVGRWLYRLLLGTECRLPLLPFDDTTWQARGIAYQPAGVVSVGARVLLAALFQTPVETRFVRDGHYTFGALAEALQAWLRLTETLGNVLDQQNASALADFSRLLPLPWQFDPESTVGNAIWQDLWTRIHASDTTPGDTLTSAESARNDALLRAKVESNIEAQTLEALRYAQSMPNLTDAQQHISQQRDLVLALARNRDVTLWALWQHLGRWQLVMSLNTASEVIHHIGVALHKLPADDTPQTLDILENTLIELNAESVLQEVRLRRIALTYRQGGDAQRFAERTAHELARVPDYLRLPAPMTDDIALQPHTLLWQIVGSIGNIRALTTEALLAGNRGVAHALLEFMRAVIVPTDPAALADVEALERIDSFLQTSGDGVNIASLFAQGAQLLSDDLLQAFPALRQPIEARLIAFGNQALQQVQQAGEQKSWSVVREAHAAWRLLTERQSRHLLEQLRTAQGQDARSLTMSATLNAYEQLYHTYQTLFTMVKQSSLWNVTHLQRPPEQQQDEARQILNTLNGAIELGIPMTDIIAYDDSTRQQWQHLINDALGTLQKMEHVTQDIDQMRQRLQGDGGFGAQLQSLAASVSSLQAQIDGNSTNVPSVMGQIQTLRAQMADVERAYMAQIEQSKRELRVTQDDIQRQLEAHDITIQRHSQQVSGANNLIQDTRERLTLVEHELLQVQKYEAQMLCTYLDAMPDAKKIDRINVVLDAVDGLVYAMRRCPVDAYDEGCHMAWMAQFEELKQRFEALANSKLSWKDRRNLKTNLRNIRALLAEVEAEANAKVEANKRVNDRPADFR